MHNLGEHGFAPADVNIVLLTYPLQKKFWGGGTSISQRVIYMNRIGHRFWSSQVSEISTRFPELPVELGIVPAVMALQLVKTAYSGENPFLK